MRLHVALAFLLMSEFFLLDRSQRRSAFVPSSRCNMPRSKLPIQQATFLLDIDFVWRVWALIGRGQGLAPNL